MVLLKRKTHEELDKRLAALVERFLDLGNSDELQEAMGELGRGMNREYIGRIQFRGRDIVGASVFHPHIRYDGSLPYILVCTKNWRTGWTVFGGKRLWVRHKKYGNYWFSREYMRAEGLTSEDMSYVPRPYIHLYATGYEMPT